ncbi:hypothetical protein FOCG_04460 [Fusarium oxysporum f. sp. radicis-lycopersici 26381]|uniref:SPX domain-containing protein n=6 Tax=Fusarium oxysporum TaxID=5507 RepID=A0A420QLU1_FUSOX|nr:uncharacterized protein FOBCDRAFT_36105 [Fusarium oxysporum Fo47]EWZ89708.1 hypothetical protein FOWG_07629 [Fusarium oxysporum f. sp. lycopersici MN25]EXL57081.1 hypothetical protein FOCG_04460 [Fusarium oxysporum f. sp. radicis-lycopersici 26381]KAF5260427.1 hypothetical protein FOXYS1_8915 [Fusarium oxysporum]PCD35428.1 hypothetical protein AU210_007998 [Fusarium oxysporum f. sp. radicis-cucumerinum]RKK19359.1 hypothetical protein BFJ65_g6081 [Fusarium oxysporum f. sp. cepae]RYC87855.1 
MKFGDHLERESVPEWSLHNLDYNSIKHEIKMHTTRDQATAMAIPGQKDEALSRFEDGLYMELDRQHERLQLFVSSKADEISRRLEYLAKNIDRWASKNQEQLAGDSAIKHHRRFTKYERELVRCGSDIQSLERFVKAQTVAFRKITKKYKKWTGSTTLGIRLYENVLSDPKSFTRRDFSSLQQRYDDITCTLNAAAPALSEPSSPESQAQSYRRQSLSGSLNSTNRHPTSRAQPTFDFLPPPQMEEPAKYWNEYDDGSECAADDDGYAIYINPDESTSFPGFGYLQNIFKAPMKKARGWFKRNNTRERQSLLGANHSPYQYSSTTFNSSESDEEAGYASSDGFPATGYATHYALPSLNQQQAHLYREKTLFWGTISSFAMSFLLLLVAGTLISTGRHRLRAEVDAGVTVGVVASLFTACSALGMTLYRHDRLSFPHLLAVWTTFVASCILNGMLLILVVGNSP